MLHCVGIELASHANKSTERYNGKIHVAHACTTNGVTLLSILHQFSTSVLTKTMATTATLAAAEVTMNAASIALLVVAEVGARGRECSRRRF